MAAYLGYTPRMKTLFRGWPVMVNDTHTRRSVRSFSVDHEVKFAVAESYRRGPRIGYLKSPCMTSYSLSAETIAVNCITLLRKTRTAFVK